MNGVAPDIVQYVPMTTEREKMITLAETRENLSQSIFTETLTAEYVRVRDRWARERILFTAPPDQDFNHQVRHVAVFVGVDEKRTKVFMQIGQLTVGVLEKMESGIVTYGFLKRISKLHPPLRPVAVTELGNRDFDYAQFAAFCDGLFVWCTPANPFDDGFEYGYGAELSQYVYHFKAQDYYDQVIGESIPRGINQLANSLRNKYRLIEATGDSLLLSRYAEWEAEGTIDGMRPVKHRLLALKQEIDTVIQRSLLTVV